VKHSILKIAGHLVRAAARKRMQSFLDQCRDSRVAQRETLRRLLDLNADSRFSRDFGLTPDLSPDEFRQRFPVSRYDRFEPYIEQVKSGERTALLGRRNELLMFALSSGTTSSSKFIPITRRFLDDYRRGWQVWGINAIDSHPGLDRGYIFQISSHPNRFQTSGGTPCGNISGLVASMQSVLIRFLYTLPKGIVSVEDPEGKYYAMIRLALADPLITWITTANPGTLVKLSALLDTYKGRLVRDIRDGTLSSPFPISDVERKSLECRRSKPNKARSRELERIVEKTGTLRPRDCWSQLKLLAVWTGGSAGAYLPTIRELFGDVPIRDHGLHASEGRMTIPFEDEVSHGILDVTSHFFEFIPEDEINSEQPVTLLPHELEEGRNYYLLMTTPSGLYRYDIHDVVKCVGFHGTTPKLEFLHKGAHISNVTGEKVAESQVVQAARAAAEALDFKLPQFTVVPAWDDPPRYRILLEQSDTPRFELTERFAALIDEQLQTLNCEYREKRESARLGQLAFQSVPDGTWDQISARRNSRLGSSLEQYKHPCLIPDLDFVKQFEAGNQTSTPLG
jgi:hypothetical protein